MHDLTLAFMSICSLAISSQTPQTNQTCNIVSDVTYTFYGFPDNDPPGPSIAYDCGRGLSAGGIGTFSNPLTFASAPGEFKECEIIYAPYLQKYLQFEDFCAECDADWANGTLHIDVWTGSNLTSGGQDQINSEMMLTPGGNQNTVRNPRMNLTVDESPLFIPGGSNSSCNVGHVYPNIRSFC